MRISNISRVNQIFVDSIIASAIWLMILFLLNSPGFPDDYSIVWVFIVFPGIPLYAYAYGVLIPSIRAKQKNFWNYMIRFFLVMIIVIIISSILAIKFVPFNSSHIRDLFIFVNVIFHLIITAPFTWVAYDYSLSKENQIIELKTALGQTTANMDFLRSQINPHFLFNALNTLYGTALQENSVRAAEGIQKLGDMMRFMLHENNKDQILLEREIDYIHNYIDLQQLRTKTSPDILVEYQISEVSGERYIAPMLLIPFIENAFKHGISLSHKSWINIQLSMNGASVHFKVRNSIHPKSGQDPEKNHSGIGLENVKQRLELLYPGNHRLNIMETSDEFFIDLQLSLTR